MPIPVVASEAGRIEAHDEAGLTKADLCYQRLETVPVSAGSSRLAKVIVKT